MTVSSGGEPWLGASKPTGFGSANQQGQLTNRWLIEDFQFG
jgi:hypothetical protein